MRKKMKQNKLLKLKKQVKDHFYALAECETINDKTQMCLDIYTAIYPTEHSKADFFKNNLIADKFRKHLEKIISNDILERDNIVTYANEYKEENINITTPFIIGYNIFLTVPKKTKDIDEFYLQILKKIDNLGIFRNKTYDVKP